MLIEKWFEEKTFCRCAWKLTLNLFPQRASSCCTLKQRTPRSGIGEAGKCQKGKRCGKIMSLCGLCIVWHQFVIRRSEHPWYHYVVDMWYLGLSLWTRWKKRYYSFPLVKRFWNPFQNSLQVEMKTSHPVLARENYIFNSFRKLLPSLGKILKELEDACKDWNIISIL